LEPSRLAYRYYMIELATPSMRSREGLIAYLKTNSTTLRPFSDVFASTITA